MAIVAKSAGVAFALVCFATVIVIATSGEALLPMDTRWQPTVRGLPAYVLAAAWLALGIAVLCASGIGAASPASDNLRRARNWAFVAMGAAFVIAAALEAVHIYGNVAF